jgi:hypothetical protein
MGTSNSFAIFIKVKRVGPRETVAIVDNIPEKVAGFGVIFAF